MAPSTSLRALAFASLAAILVACTDPSGGAPAPSTGGAPAPSTGGSVAPAGSEAPAASGAPSEAPAGPDDYEY